MSALEGLNGEFRDKILHLEGDIISVGRADTNALRLTDSLVSGSHCAFIRVDGRWTLKDYESTNGSQVNGQLIDEAILFDKDVVTIGNSQFRFLAEAAGEGSALIDSDLIEMGERAEVTQVMPDIDIEEVLRQSRASLGPPPVPSTPPAAAPIESEPESAEGDSEYYEYESAIYRAPVEAEAESEFLEVGESDIIDGDDNYEEYESAIFRSPAPNSSVMEDNEDDEDDDDDYEDDDDDEAGLAEWLERPSIANTGLAIATSLVLMLLIFAYLSRVM